MSDKKRFLGIDPSYIYIAFTLGAILTYIVDLVLGKFIHFYFEIFRL